MSSSSENKILEAKHDVREAVEDIAAHAHLQSNPAINKEEYTETKKAMKHAKKEVIDEARKAYDDSKSHLKENMHMAAKNKPEKGVIEKIGENVTGAYQTVTEKACEYTGNTQNL